MKLDVSTPKKLAIPHIELEVSSQTVSGDREPETEANISGKDLKWRKLFDITP